MPCATEPPETEETDRIWGRSPASAMKRRTPSALSVARNPPPENARAKAGSLGGGGSGDRGGPLSEHADMRSLGAVPMEFDSRGERVLTGRPYPAHTRQSNG